MSDEEDYMSEEFLKSLEKTKRKFEAEKKKAESDPKRIKEREEEKREEGLSKAIDSSNKGFQMLMKMGFSGKLGKEDGQGTSRERGLREPIPISLKINRQGIGKQIKKKTQSLDPVLLDKFHEKERSNLSCRQTRLDVSLSQKACYNLDSESGMEDPEKQFYWPRRIIQSLSQETDKEGDCQNEQLEVTDEEYCEQLKDITKYLRSKYNYCVWCGIRFEDSNDMQDSCPGTNRACHED